MTYQHNTDQINQLADKLEDPELASMSGLGWKAAFHLRELQGRIAELEAQLYAVGVGGIGQSIKAQQKPVAWIDVKPNPFDPSCRGAASVQDHALPPREHKLYAAPQPTESLRCKSTQKRLATLWGYVKKEPDHFRDAAQMVPARQPLTNEQIIAIADNARAAESGDAGYILPIAFARAIEAAHGITESQL